MDNTDANAIHHVFMFLNRISLVAQELLNFIDDTGARDIVRQGCYEENGKIKSKKMPFHQTATYCRAVQSILEARSLFCRYELSMESKAVEANGDGGITP